MKILLTGATGFIGRYVYARLLKTDHDIYITSRFQQENLRNCYVLDILDHEASREIIKKIKPDALIHLAWDVTHGEFWGSSKNDEYAQASINLFEAFIANGGRKIIATGTCAEYPASADPVFEDRIYEGKLSAYGMAKLEVLSYLESIKKTHDIDFTWVRIFGIFGAGEDSRRFFPSMIRAIQAHQEYPIQNPDIFFDYVYVDDMACFTVNCLQQSGLGIVNVGTGESFALGDYYLMLKSYVMSRIFEKIRTIMLPCEFSHIPDCTKLIESGCKMQLKSGFITMFGG